MMVKISNVLQVLKEILYFNFFLTKEEISYRKSRTNIVSNGSDILLIPLLDDLPTMKMIIDMGESIAEEENLRIKFFFAHTALDHKHIQTSKIFGALLKLKRWTFFSKRKLRRIYRINSEDLIMSNFIELNKPQIGVSKFSSKSDVLRFTYNGIELGELLYDTYLRFRSKPTISTSDLDLYEIKDYAERLSEKWEIFFKEHTISKLVMPYMAYIHWGIPGKVAFKNNIDVITFGSNLYLFQRITQDYPYHTKNFKKYPRLFSLISDQQACMDEAKIVLENRLRGIIDKGISYMKNSAFDTQKQEGFTPPSNRKWAVVFLHCFFDSPHIYGDGLFSDFYDWLTYILTVACENPDVIYFVKSHPNGLPENKLVILEFVRKFSTYKNIIFLRDGISNALIASGRPDAIFTYYGTVAHEFAYLGIPAVTCGLNPHSYYGFIYNASSISQLYQLLKEVGNYGLPEDYKKEDILAFFYMHYMYYSSLYNQTNYNLNKDFTAGSSNISKEVSYKHFIYGN